MLETIKYQSVPLGRDDVDDLAGLVTDLLALPELAARPDALGNMQGVLRIVDNAPRGYLVTFPADVDAAVVKAAIASHDPTPPPPPPDRRVWEALAAIQPLDPATATSAEIADAVNKIKAVVEAALAPPPP